MARSNRSGSSLSPVALDLFEDQVRPVDDEGTSGVGDEQAVPTGDDQAATTEDEQAAPTDTVPAQPDTGTKTTGSKRKGLRPIAKISPLPRRKLESKPTSTKDKSDAPKSDTKPEAAKRKMSPKGNSAKESDTSEETETEDIVEASGSGEAAAAAKPPSIVTESEPESAVEPTEELQDENGEKPARKKRKVAFESLEENHAEEVARARREKAPVQSTAGIEIEEVGSVSVAQPKVGKKPSAKEGVDPPLSTKRGKSKDETTTTTTTHLRRSTRTTAGKKAESPVAASTTSTSKKGMGPRFRGLVGRTTKSATGKKKEVKDSTKAKAKAKSVKAAPAAEVVAPTPDADALVSIADMTDAITTMVANALSTTRLFWRFLGQHGETLGAGEVEQAQGDIDECLSELKRKASDGGEGSEKGGRKKRR
jgi:hypothetical protein